MITLDAATKSLEIRLGSAVSTAQPQFVVAYTDIGQVNQQVVSMAESDGVTNDTTAVTLLAAPDAGNSRVVRYLSVFNADDADVEVRISVNNNATIREVLWITLTPDQTLEFAQGQWGVINVAGDFQPLSTKLTSLALLDGGADKLPYFSGPESFSQTDFTAFARGFIALTDEPYREILDADLELYVNGTTGDDNYDGLSPTDDGGGVGPFATIQKGIDTVASHDLGIFDATINVEDDTYPDPIVIKTLVGAGTCRIVGNTATPANALISTGASNAIDGTAAGNYHLEGFKIETTNRAAINVAGSVYFTYNDIDFGSTGVSFHQRADGNAVLQALGDYEITGGADRHLVVTNGGRILAFAAMTITLTGTPAFSTAFADASLLSAINFNSANVTFSGAATGQRYDVRQNSLIHTNSGGGNYFPGDVAGATATGGQYT